MNKIEAVIAQHRLEEVERALLKFGIGGMTISSVHQFPGSTQALCAQSSARGAQLERIPQLKVELITDDDETEAIKVVIQSAAGTNGRTTILVSDLDCLYHIRSGILERSSPAIHPPHPIARNESSTTLSTSKISSASCADE